jgi:hypothetical protein
LLWESEHQTLDIICVGNQSSWPSIQAEGVKNRKQETQHDLKTGDCRMEFGHDKNEAFGLGLIWPVDGDTSLYFH